MKQTKRIMEFAQYVSLNVMGMIGLSCYILADTFFVSKGLGTNGLAALNLAIPIYSFVNGSGLMIGMGGGIRYSIRQGQKEGEEANRVFTCAVYLAAVFAVFFVLLGIGCPGEIVRAFGADEHVYEMARTYLQVILLFAPAFLLNNVLLCFVRNDGAPQLSMAAMIGGSLSNIVLDWVFIFPCGMGIFGAAFATGLSQLLTCVMYLTHFLGKHTTFHLVRFRPDRHIYRRLLPIGVADGATELCNGLMIFLFNRTILRCIGQDGLVSYTIIAYINTLILNIMLGVSQGSQPLVSYHYGQRDRKGCRRLLQYGLVTLAGMTVLCFGAVQLFAPQIVHIFLGDNNAALSDVSVGALRRYGLCYLLVGFNVLMGGFLTAVEQPRPAICISTGRGLVLQAGALLALAALWGGEAIWFAPVISEVVCLVMALAFMGRFWKSNRTLAAA